MTHRGGGPTIAVTVPTRGTAGAATGEDTDRPIKILETSATSSKQSASTTTRSAVSIHIATFKRDRQSAAIMKCQIVLTKCRVTTTRANIDAACTIGIVMAGVGNPILGHLAFEWQVGQFPIHFLSPPRLERLGLVVHLILFDPALGVGIRCTDQKCQQHRQSDIHVKRLLKLFHSCRWFAQSLGHDIRPMPLGLSIISFGLLSVIK